MSCIKASIEYFYLKFYETFGQKKNTFCMDLNFNPNTWNSKKKMPSCYSDISRIYKHR